MCDDLGNLILISLACLLSYECICMCMLCLDSAGGADMEGMFQQLFGAGGPGNQLYYTLLQTYTVR